MVNPSHQFHLADYCIFAVTIVVSLGIGIYYALSGGKQRTTSEYFVGNRRMTIIPVAISLMVSFESSIMMLGTPAEIYVYGFQWIIGNIGFLVANILSIIIIVPLVHPLKITSAYEYLEMRFNSHAVRILGTVLGMAGYTCYMGIVLFGPAIALEAVTGLPQWTSIVSIALASVIYTSIGGLKAVIWTDVFQCVVMFAGFFAVLIKGTIEIGGVRKTWEIAQEKGRLNVFNFDPNPTVRHTFWNLFFGTVIRGVGLVFNQSSIQRISSTPTLSAAKKVLYLVAPGYFITMTLAAIEGIIAYAYYDTKGCDPLKSEQIANPNQIIPYMVMDVFQGLQGMPGLFMASLFSASLSTSRHTALQVVLIMVRHMVLNVFSSVFTLSSGLSSLSALFWTDLVKPHTKPMSELRATVISKISVFVFGGLAVTVAFAIAYVGGTLIQITGSILSAFGGPLSGLFLFGAFCPWGNGKGAFWGTILSAVITFVISVGQMTVKGTVRDTKLPPGPVDFCPVVNQTVQLLLGNMTSYNETDMYLAVWLNGTATDAVSTIATLMEDETEPTGFNRIFMVSYTWFGVIGILQVVLYGSLISFCTGYSKPGEVERRYLIPFFDKLCPCIPAFIRRRLHFGYEYTDTKVDEKLPEFLINDAGVNNLQFTIKPQDDGDQDVNSAMLSRSSNGNVTSVNGDVNETAKENAKSQLEGNKSNEPKRDRYDISKSYDNLSPPVRSPVKDIEMTLMKADSTDVHNTAYIVTENTKEGVVLQLRAKSVEMDILPSD